jgi:hypothetical protein
MCIRIWITSIILLIFRFVDIECMSMSSFSALHRLITAEIVVQEGQLDTLESILVLAGERSSSIPDPHHLIEGDAADRLIAQLLGDEEKHDRVVPLISSEIEHVERRLRRPDGAPPSHMGTLAKELEDFSTLQADALKSLRSSHSTQSAGGLTISAAMASKLFDVLATKLELLRELQDGFIQLRTTEAEESARASQSTQQQLTTSNKNGAASMISAAIRDFGSNDDTKQSLGLKFAKSLVADGVDALASGSRPTKRHATPTSSNNVSTALVHSSSCHSDSGLQNPLDAARRAAKSFLGVREESTASSAASWKNDFHEAVMRTMMQSESPEEALAGVVSRMPASIERRSTSVDSQRSVTSSRSGSEASAERDARRRSATRRRVPSVSPSPAPPRLHAASSSTQLEADSLLVLRSEVDDLQASTSELLTEANRIISDCDEAVLQLSSENEALREEVLRLQNAADSRRRGEDDSDAHVQQSVKDLHQALANSKQENSSLSRLLAEERNQHASARSELATLQDEFRRASHAAAQQGDELRRAKESVRELDAAVSRTTAKLDATVAQHDRELHEKDALIASLRLRVQTLEIEASTHFSDLEASRSALSDTVRKLERKQLEVKDVKLLFTELEASGRDTKSELRALRAAVTDKDNALGRYANLSRLKEQHASPPRRAADSTGASATPMTGATPRGGARRGSQGRLVRLSFDSPARAATPPPHAQEAPALSVRPVTPRGGSVTNAQHVQKVLADAASLLATIQKTRRSAETPDPHDPTDSVRAGAPRVPPSLQAMNGSDDGISPVTPLTRPQLSQQKLLHDLEEKERHLMSEAASLAEQERSLLDKRSVVSSTLLAQRNQMLMKNAPDDEVEKLNIQISAVMERINQTTAQIQQNKRSVESKMDLMQRQRRALLAGGGVA